MFSINVPQTNNIMLASTTAVLVPRSWVCLTTARVYFHPSRSLSVPYPTCKPPFAKRVPVRLYRSYDDRFSFACNFLDCRLLKHSDHQCSNMPESTLAMCEAAGLERSSRNSCWVCGNDGFQGIVLGFDGGGFCAQHLLEFSATVTRHIKSLS